MSTRRGSAKKQGQRHQNKTAFKNDLYDTSDRTKMINNLSMTGVCQRCKEILEWKIKYKKYKPLTVPKKCVKCDMKTVKHAYRLVCAKCASVADICEKCGEKKDIVARTGPSEREQQAESSKLEQEIKSLPERKRRTFYRYLERGEKQGTGKDEELHKEAMEVNSNCVDIDKSVASDDES